MITEYEINWAVPGNIGYFISTNETGNSKGKYKHANFSNQVGEDSKNVESNINELKTLHGLNNIIFMNQTLVAHYGRTSGFNPTPDIILQQTSNSQSIISFDTGDTNHDGCDDVIFGMPYLNSSNGGARLHLGSSNGLDPAAFWDFTSSTNGGSFGSKVVFIGDTHNDGYTDWAVLASDEAGSGSVVGRIHLFDGGSQPPVSSSLTLSGTGTNLQYGWAIEALGDIQGDGYDDFAVSSAGGLFDLTCLLYTSPSPRDS